MADRKLELKLSADASQLKNDLTALSTQLTQLNQLATVFNKALSGNGLQSSLVNLIAQFSQLSNVTTSFAGNLNTGLTQAAIANEKLAQSQQKTTQSVIQTQASQEKLAQTVANRQKSEESLAQTVQKSATQQQIDAAKVAIANENILKATAQRESAEARLASASKQSAQQQEASSKSLLGGIQGIAFGFNNLIFSVQNFAGLANGVFQSLVGSSIQLEEQLISIRGALSATNDVQSGGKSISDPLERINKLAPSVNKAISQVRKDSEELANVTSDDLIGVFKIISGEVGNIGASLDDAAKLTKAFGSSFSALSIPLSQSRQEVVSVLQGTIDQNSSLAKTLSINNVQIQQEKAKGTLVDFLLKKTEALAASQSLISKSFGGISSNIVEIFQRLQESFGKIVLPPVVEQLDKVYKSLLQVRPQVEELVTNLGKGFIQISTNLKLVFDAVLPLFVEFGKTLGSIASASLPVLQAGFTLFLGSAISVANLLTTVLSPVLQLLQSDFGKFAVSVGLVAIAFNKAIPIILTFAGQTLNLLLGSLAAVIAAFTGQLGLVAGFNAFVLGAEGAALAAKLLGGTLGALALSVGAIVAVVAAAAGAFYAYSKASEAATATNAAFANSTNEIIRRNTALEKSIASLQEKQKKGTITPEELQTLKGLLALYKQGTKDIEAQIADQQKIIAENGLGSALGVSADKTIKQLQDQKAKIEQFFDETTITGQKAKDQGTLKEQFNTVSNNYYDEFKKGTNLAVTQAKELVSVLSQEVELGIRSKEEGLKRLQELSQGEFLLKEDRIAAAKAATAIIDRENKAQADSNNTKQAAIQAQIEAGSLSEIDGIKKTSALKEEAKNLEIKGIDEKLKFAIAGSDAERDLINQRKKAVTELSKIQTEETQKQVQILRGNLDRELQANTQLRTKAEQALQADLFALKLGGFENDLQLREQELLQTKRNTDAEIFDKQRQLEFDKTLLANFVGSQQQREALILKIGAAESDIAKLNLAQTQNLIDRYKLLQDTKVKGFEVEKAQYDKVSKLLQSQSDLLQAQFKLEGAIADAQVKSSEVKLSGLKEAQSLLKGENEAKAAKEQEQIKKTRDIQREALLVGLSDEEKASKIKQFELEDRAEAEKVAAEKQAKTDANNAEKKRLTLERLSQLGISAGSSELAIARQIFDEEEKLLQLKARKFEAEQAAARTQLEISIQQSGIRDKQLAIEAKIALTKAKASGDKSAIADALELVNLTNEQIANNSKIGDLQRKTLDTTQASERESFNAQQDKASFDARLTGADAGLRGLTRNDNVRAGVIESDKPTSIADAKKTITKDVKANTQKALDERKSEIGEVSQGAVAFKDTAEDVQAAFASLPDSLSQTKKGLQDVVSLSKELSENPIFKSREEQAAKQKQAEAIAQTQQKTQAQPQATPQPNDPAIAKGANAAITAKNTKITNQNELGAAANKIVSVDTALIGIGNQEEIEANREANRKNDRILRAKKRTRGRGLFTGGYAAPSESVTVNERGQEAVTNLQTLETSLLPNGERTVQFEAPTWVHNAAETKQLGSLGVFDSNQLPNINFEAIASTLRINNSELLNEMRLQNGLLSQIADGMKKPNQVLSPTFNNVERPDLQMYRLQQQLLRK